MLTELGFKHIESDHSVYIHLFQWRGLHHSLFPSTLMIYITLASKFPTAINKYVKLLSQYFKYCDFDATCFLLGITVERDYSTCTLKLHQCQFILDILEKYRVSDCNHFKLPCLPNLLYHIIYLLTHRRKRASCPKYPILVQLNHFNTLP